LLATCLAGGGALRANGAASDPPQQSSVRTTQAETEAEMKVAHTFTLHAPDARQVFLAGEMTAWDHGKLPMRRGADGRWTVTLALGRGEWLYKFIVDGGWIRDPANTDFDSDGQGGEHSILFVGEGDWTDRAGMARGRVETFNVPSAAWGRPMKVNVYLPPGLDGGRQYPVLWLLHGAGMDADQWYRTGKIERYMDNLIARKVIAPYVIVMPSSERVPYTGKSERFVTEELPDWLARHYGLKPARNANAIAGMSMGGGGAFELALRHPERYGFSFGLSGYYAPATVARVRLLNRLPMRSVLRCGTEDQLLQGNRHLVRTLQDRSLPFDYREDPGGHTWHYWSQRMVEMLSSVDRYFRAAE
jgi:enterochelin esterase-like enzyme